jgi:uncharacterized protein (TIGR03083 family)
MEDIAIRAEQIPRTTAAQAANLSIAELDKALVLLRSLDEQLWARPTDCPGWTVTDMVAHMVGQYQAQARPLLGFARLRRARRRYPDLTSLAAHNQQQIDELAHLSPADLIAAMDTTGRRGIRARGRIPRPLRGLRASRMYPEEQLPDDRLDYVMDILSPRDAWMHRVDIARATEQPLVLDQVDQAIVAQVLRDLGRAWAGPGLLLELSGPAGGSWTIGYGSPVATIGCDAVAYMRTLAGRADQPRMDAHGNTAVVGAAVAARVVF